MKSHLTLSTTHQQADVQSENAAVVGAGAVAADAYDRPHLTLVPTRPWTHTLILKGNLDQRSAPELEDEIECLSQEGVTTLTLDLRQLDAIDSSGAEVIASQGTFFKRRGARFAALVGSPLVQRALTEAGGTDLVTPARSEGITRGFSSPSSPATPEVSTTMMKHLGLH